MSVDTQSTKSTKKTDKLLYDKYKANLKEAFLEASPDFMRLVTQGRFSELRTKKVIVIPEEGCCIATRDKRDYTQDKEGEKRTPIPFIERGEHGTHTKLWIRVRTGNKYYNAKKKRTYICNIQDEHDSNGTGQILLITEELYNQLFKK